MFLEINFPHIIEQTFPMENGNVVVEIFIEILALKHRNTKFNVILGY